MNADPYTGPPDWVLWNRLGITDRAALRAAEDLLVSSRLAELDSIELPPTYGWELLSAIHLHLFQDVYEWAGMRRVVGIAKNQTSFTPHELIEREVEEFVEELADTRPPRSIPQFVPVFARLYERLNHIHPFREGNGRAQRAFWELYLREFGLEFAWSPDDKSENDEACAAGADGDFGPLERLLGRIIHHARGR